VRTWFAVPLGNCSPSLRLGAGFAYRSIGIVACSDTSLQVLSYECECTGILRSPNTLQNFAALRAQMPKHLDFHNVARISYAFWVSPIGSVALTTCGLTTTASEQTGRSALLATFIATLIPVHSALAQWPGSGHSRDFPLCFGRHFRNCIPPLAQRNRFSCLTIGSSLWPPLSPVLSPVPGEDL
jgi:hypothetical protein